MPDIHLLNEVFEIISYVGLVLTIIFNGYLIWLILRHTGIAMKPFSKILLQSVITDVITSVIFTFLQLQLESYKNVVFARGGPFWFGPNNRMKCSTVTVGAIVANVCYWSAPLQSLYRYFMVCRRKVLSVYTTLAIQLAIVIILGIPGIPYYLEYTPLNQSPKNLALLQSLDAWAHETNVAETFCFLEIKLNFVVGLYTSLLLLFNNAGFAVFIWTSWKVYHLLETSKAHMSVKTRNLHRDFSKMLLYQTILPCFSASLIVVIVMLAITMKNYDGGLYIILMFPFPLISFINPIITILCVKRYRQVTASVLTGKPVLASISMDRRSTWVSTINDGAVPSFQGVHETHVVT